jgi:alkyl hydroperoxide reductase subunit AhpC
MIGDHDKRISKAYGTSRALIGLYKRVTFVIDRSGIVRGVFHHELAIDKHVDQVLAMFRAGF